MLTIFNLSQTLIFKISIFKRLVLNYVLIYVSYYIIILYYFYIILFLYYIILYYIILCYITLLYNYILIVVSPYINGRIIGASGYKFMSVIDINRL